MNLDSVAVIGASFAGLSAAQELLNHPEVTAVTIYGAEPPCDRPALSKQYLLGAWDEESVLVPMPTDPRLRWCAERVVSVDVYGGVVTTESSTSTKHSGGVVIATGVRPRTTTGADLDGVFVIRTLEDARRLRSRLVAGAKLLIVGGGFIGMEVAAAGIIAGTQVRVLEAGKAPLERALGPELGWIVTRPLVQRGVEIRCNAMVQSLDGDGAVTGVTLATGEKVAADIVVLGIGVTPEVDWARATDLDVTDGVLADAFLRIAPGAVVAGDVARWPNARTGETRRVEHWDNAVRQGVHAARTLLADHGIGEAEPFAVVPWVWSDQLDNKIQIAGSTVGFEDWVVIDGALDESQFIVAFRKGDEVSAVLGMNAARAVTAWRRRLVQPVSWAEAIAKIEVNAS